MNESKETNLQFYNPSPGCSVELEMLRSPSSTDGADAACAEHPTTFY